MSKDERDTPDGDQSTPVTDSHGGPTDSPVTAAIASAIEAFGGLPLQAPSAVESDDSPVVRPPGVAIEFRVVRPGLPVRRLKLTGNRYTFGSGEGCSIRLDDQTLRPMHAVLLRDAHRILMRAYSVPLECNGDRVAETELRIGDVIRMGSYRFELLSGPQPTPGQGSAGAKQNQALQQRLTDLSQQWHARHAECEVRESRCDQRESELHSRESELWQRAERIQRREHLLMAQESAVKEIQQTYEDLQNNLSEAKRREEAANEHLEQSQSKLSATEEQLRERQAELASRRDEWRRREEEFVARSEDTQRKLDQAQDQAQAAGDAVTRMRSEFATLNEQLTELRDQHRALQERERQEQQEHERLRGVLEAARDEAIEAASQSESQREAAEAARTDAEQNLEQMADRLSDTQAELDSLRQESKAKQHELFEKLRETSEELNTTRAEAEQTRLEADRARELAEQTGLELSSVKDELAKAQTKADKARNEADFARSEAEKLLAKAERVRSEADDAHREAQTAHGEAEQAKIDAQMARNRAEQARVEAEQAREESERARLEAEQARSEIGHLQQLESQHSEAEERVRVLSEQLTSMQASAGDEELAAQETITRLQEELEQAQASKEESFQAAEQLRSELHTLEERYAKANAEAERLQSEFEGAQASIRQLELLVDQTQESQSTRHSSWAEEAEQLQQTIDELSTQLSRANAELSELRTSNDALQAEIKSDAGRAVDPDRSELDQSEFETLENELAAARQEIELLKISHAETLEKIKNEREENEHALRDEIEQLRQEIAAAQSWASQAVSEVASDEATETPAESSVSDEESASSETLMEEADEVAIEEPAPQQGEVSSAWATAGFIAAGDASQVDAVDDRVELESETDASVAQVLAEQTSFEHDTLQQSEPEGEPDSDWSSVDWGTSEYATDVREDESLSGLTPAGEPEDEAAGQTDAGVEWHDEPPEESVSHAIDEIEENVEEAISDLQDPIQEQNEGFVDPNLEQQEFETLQEQEAGPQETYDHQHESLLLDEEVDPDDQAQSVSDSELVRQLINADDATSATEAEPPSDWSAYMPGGEIESPSDSEPEAYDESETEPPEEPTAFSPEQLSLGEFRNEGLRDESQPAISGEGDLGSAEIAESNESMDVSGSLTTEPTQAWDAAAAFAAEEDPEPVMDGNATQQWSTIYDVGGSRNSDESSESGAEEVSPQDEMPSLDVNSEHTAENDDAPEPYESDSISLGKTTGSLAEMLIRDLDRESDQQEASNDEAGVSSSWYGEPEVDSPIEVVGDAESTYEEEPSHAVIEDSDPSDQTFVMDAAPELDSPESTSAWNFESPEPQTEGHSDSEPEQATELFSGFTPSELDAPVQSDTATPDENTTADNIDEPDDDSIEAYMNRLLQRVQGGTPATPVTPIEEPKAEENIAPSETQSQPRHTSDDAEALPEDSSPEPHESAADSLHDTQPLVPRSHAPELTRNLSAMRELANQSARNAVARSIRVQARDTQMKAMFKGAFAASLTLVAIGIYFFITIWVAIKLVAIGCLLVLTFVFGREAYVQARDARRRLALADDGIETDEQQRAIEEEMRRIAEADELSEEESMP